MGDHTPTETGEPPAPAGGATLDETPEATRRGVLGPTTLDRLRLMIAAGDLPPGTRLVERVLSEQLGVSRGPVREAIRALEHEGLVTSRPNAGATVTPIQRDEIDEIVALRRQVEYFGLARAAFRRDLELAAELEELCTRMGQCFAEADERGVLELDLIFHLRIAEASGHSILSTVMNALLPRLAVLFFPQILSGHSSETFEQAHREYLEPIRTGDVELALTAVDSHVSSFNADLELRLGPRVMRDAIATAAPLARPYTHRREPQP